MITLHHHQREAVEAARSGERYILTARMGSGKSLAYMSPIVDRVLKEVSRRQSVKAIIVHPMNAFANSQLNELEKFLRYGCGVVGSRPIACARGVDMKRDGEPATVSASWRSMLAEAVNGVREQCSGKV